jgi:hypothetical protein
VNIRHQDGKWNGVGIHKQKTEGGWRSWVV